MIDIIPAIMPKNLEDLREHAARVKGLTPMVQMDVVDGRFAPQPTWPYVPAEGLEEFRQLAREEASLPLWDALEYEIDLMVEKPETVVDGWVMAGAKRLVVHSESTNDFSLTLKALAGRYAKGGENAGDMLVELGLALNLETPLAAIEPYLEDIAFVQLMGIARIGFQGEPFDERVLGKMHECRLRWPNLTLSIDGGVHDETAPLLIAAGANRLVVGSALFESGDIGEAFKRFRSYAPRVS